MLRTQLWRLVRGGGGGNIDTKGNNASEGSTMVLQ